MLFLWYALHLSPMIQRLWESKFLELPCYISVTHAHTHTACTALKRCWGYFLSSSRSECVCRRALHSLWHIFNLKNVWSMMQHQLLSLSSEPLSSEKSPLLTQITRATAQVPHCVSIMGAKNALNASLVHFHWESYLFLRCSFKA